MSEEHGPEPSEEQIRAFEEQLKQLRVEDVLVQTLVTFVNLGARRLGLSGEPEALDLAQAQLAIARETQGAPEPPADAPQPAQGGPGGPGGPAAEQPPAPGAGAAPGSDP